MAASGSSRREVQGPKTAMDVGEKSPNKASGRGGDDTAAGQSAPRDLERIRRRTWIPKTDGRLRHLGVPTHEDKIVQTAMVEVLNAIYEPEFLGFSYGFRPGRSQHQALDALAVGIHIKKVSWVLDLDLRDFFGTLKHEWLV